MRPQERLDDAEHEGKSLSFHVTTYNRNLGLQVGKNIGTVGLRLQREIVKPSLGSACKQ
jgi:hypothetical protein